MAESPSSGHSFPPTYGTAQEVAHQQRAREGRLLPRALAGVDLPQLRVAIVNSELLLVRANLTLHLFPLKFCSDLVADI